MSLKQLQVDYQEVDHIYKYQKCFFLGELDSSEDANTWKESFTSALGVSFAV